MDQAPLLLLGVDGWFQILFYGVILDTKNYASNLDTKDTG